MKSALLLVLTLLFSINNYAQKKIVADFLIQNINVINVVNGTVQSNQSVAIKGNKIIAIDAPTKATQTIDGTGKYLIPGLWDMHTHYNWNYTFANGLLVGNGITGIREMWGDMTTIQHIRAQVKADSMIAPDIYASGNIIDGKPQIWPGSAGVSTLEEVENELDSQIAQGVDFFKVYSLLSKEAYLAIAEKSKASGIPFAGHIPDAVNFWEAIEAGQQSVEHLYGLLEVCTSQPEKLKEYSGWKLFSAERKIFLITTFDQTLFDSLATKLANSNTWVSPTLSVLNNISHLDDTTMVNDPRMAYMPTYFRQMWNPKNDFRFKNAPKSYFEAERKLYQLQSKLISQLEKAGVKIIAGTDYSNPYCYPGFSLHDELELMVKGGVSEAAALKSATYHPALLMNKEEYFGQIKEGQLANLIILDANPLVDIRHTKKINTVFLRGKYMNRAALDDLLEAAKTIAKETNSPFLGY